MRKGDACMFRGENCHGVMCCFGNPFCIAVPRAAMLVHGDYLCLGGDSIEEFFNVVTDGCTSVVQELLSIFQKHDVIKSEVID